MSLPIQKVYEICNRALLRHGASAKQANAIAKMLTAAERDGCHSHGLYRLPAFVQGCSSVNVKAVPSVKEKTLGTICVDGEGGFQQYAQEVGLEVLQRNTKSNGIGMLAVHNTFGMSGAMWYVAEQLADEGLVSMVFANSPPYVAAHGGKRAVFGTNPFAFGWPRPGTSPLVFDQASSGMARGEIELHRQRGEEVPLGVGLDPEGNPTTDPAKILSPGGVQLPFGLHKGSNISIMIELMGAALVGSDLAITKPPGTSAFDEYNRGLLVIAIDPGAVNTDSLFSGEALLGGLEADDVRLPSSRRYKHRAKVVGGEPVEIPHETLTEALKLAEMTESDLQ